MTSLFCRHNRFTADCPICSKGTVLDPERQGTRPRSSSSGSASSRSGSSRSGGSSRRLSPNVAREVKGPYVSAGPYDSDEGLYEVRLEKVPGGLRLASWARSALQRWAPIIEIDDLGPMIAAARERSLFQERDIAALEAALATTPSEGGSGLGSGTSFGASAGWTGDFREELRAEPLDDDRLRIARWILRPNQGWELQEAPVMLPAKRYAEAIRTAARAGLLSPPAEAADIGAADDPESV